MQIFSIIIILLLIIGLILISLSPKTFGDTNCEGENSTSIDCLKKCEQDPDCCGAYPLTINDPNCVVKLQPLWGAVASIQADQCERDPHCRRFSEYCEQNPTDTTFCNQKLYYRGFRTDS